MRRIIVVLMAIGFLASCQETESTPSDFTGNEVVFALQPGSVYDISGTITLKEKKDHSALALISLTGTEGNLEHPVHLHLGDISKADASVAVLLNPVLGSTGKSETNLNMFADESPLTYDQLVNLDACIKVHLGASGPERDIILAGGNIGAAAANDLATGRVNAMGVCKSE